LTDQKDLSPYLSTIIPGLKASLLDPVPDVRSVSARALGAMVRGMGEASFDDLLPWLMQTLTSESSSVDRSGAAQGLSEVVGGLGVDKLHKLMPEIIATAERQDIAPHVKVSVDSIRASNLFFLLLLFPNSSQGQVANVVGVVIKNLLNDPRAINLERLENKRGLILFCFYYIRSIKIEPLYFDVFWLETSKIRG
jgi:HEAT repeat protein